MKTLKLFSTYAALTAPRQKPVRKHEHTQQFGTLNATLTVRSEPYHLTSSHAVHGEILMLLRQCRGSSFRRVYQFSCTSGLLHLYASLSSEVCSFFCCCRGGCCCFWQVIVVVVVVVVVDDVSVVAVFVVFIFGNMDPAEVVKSLTVHI